VANFSRGSILSNGVRINYYRTGGEKPPIVLLHGITDNGLCWKRIARMLEPFLDVVMIDARGHGLSDAPPSGYSYEHMAGDVTALIEQLGLSVPVIIGHSMGASTAAVLAARYPELVKSILLEDPPWKADEQSDAERLRWGEQLRGNIAAFHKRTDAELIALCEQIHPGWHTDDVDEWARAKKQVRAEISQISAQSRPRWQDLIREIRCPMLLITSNRGGIVSPEVAAEVEQTARKCFVVEIPNAGHNIRRKQFATYVNTIRSFLNL
jgi:N-formylmaleamate deformylase